MKGLGKYKAKIDAKDPGANIVLKDVEAVSTDGPGHTLVMKKDGSVWGWSGSYNISLGEFFSTRVKSQQ